MRKFLYLSALFIGAMATFIGAWIVAFIIAGHFGFNNQTTPKYGFTSGLGPMLETAIFGSTVLVGLWHSLNCHDDDCFRIGKHRVNGSPYCTKHHHDVRHHATHEELLQVLVEQNEDLHKFLGVPEQ